MTRLPAWPSIKLTEIEQHESIAAGLIVDVVETLEPDPAPIADTSSVIVVRSGGVSKRDDPMPAGGLAIYYFGNFRVYSNDVLIDRWESAREMQRKRRSYAGFGLPPSVRSLLALCWRVCSD